MRAVDLLGRAREKAPDAPVIDYHLGMALFKSGKRAEAKVSLGRSLSGSRSFPGRKEAVKLLQKL